jgi:hypothetical protein
MGRIAATSAADTIAPRSTARSSFGTRLGRIALAGLVTAGLWLSATPMPASADAPFGFVGVSAEEVYWASGADQAQALGQMRVNGITELRQIVRWSDIEQIQGVNEWRLLDALILAAARHNIRVLPILGGEVPWATSRPPGDERRCLFPPRDNATFANHVRQVVARYGPGGTLWQANPDLGSFALKRWQLWNEPNTDTFWACDKNPKAYMRLAKAAANAVHDIDPNASIITGGAPNKAGGDYLRKTFKNGAKSVFDALALHPYKKTADDVLAEVKQARSLLNDLGAKRWKLRITEFGWATGGPFHKVHTVDEAKQRRLVKNTYTKLGAQRSKLKLTGVAYYAWRDAPVPTDFGGGSDYWGNHTGLLRLDATPKPALSAMLEASRAIN